MEIKEAIEFLKKYTDDEVYTHKCITSHNMAISAHEKQEKISRTVLEGKYFCPRCKCLMIHSGYCKNCGQNTY